MSKKKRALKALVWLGVIVAACMYFSRTIQTITTPKVKLVQATTGRIEQKISVDAKPYFPVETEITLNKAKDYPITVDKVYVKPGLLVKEGDTIFTATINDYQTKEEDLLTKYNEKSQELIDLDIKNRKNSKQSMQNDLYDLMIEKQDKMEMVLKRVAQFLAANTNYASMITGPQYHRTKLKFIQLSIVSEDQLLAVVVTEGNVVKNKMISLHHGLDQETVLKLNILLNTSLNGLTMDQINLTTIAKIKEEAGIHSEVVNSVLDAVAEAIQMDEEEMEIYTSGATNIFKYPELSDSEKASSLIGTFEEKKQLADLVADTMADDKNTGIQVYIGNETPVQTMKDCSVVTATYELGDGMRGTIGIIGPKRMDYDRVVGTLKTLTTQLDDIFGKKKEDN